jgi:Domain of unknown function (DUF5679)
MQAKTRRNKLPQLVIVRSPGLLPMLYSPRELCEELGTAESTLRDWLQMGAPSQRDNRNRIWIQGEKFASWVKEQKKLEPTGKLNSDEAYCLHCKQVTRLISPKVLHIKGNLVHIKGTCPNCGHTINRGDRYGGQAELS